MPNPKTLLLTEDADEDDNAAATEAARRHGIFTYRVEPGQSAPICQIWAVFSDRRGGLQSFFADEDAGMWDDQAAGVYISGFVGPPPVSWIPLPCGVPWDDTIPSFDAVQAALELFEMGELTAKQLQADIRDLDA